MLDFRQRRPCHDRSFDRALWALLQSPELIDHIERLGVTFSWRGDRL